MTSMMDTGGKHPIVYQRGTNLRLGRRTGDLDQMGRRDSYRTTFAVTFDPSGTPQNMESQYDYSVMMCDETR
jgi:hypothetical protein